MARHLSYTLHQILNDRYKIPDIFSYISHKGAIDQRCCAINRETLATRIYRYNCIRLARREIHPLHPDHKAHAAQLADTTITSMRALSHYAHARALARGSNRYQKAYPL